MEAILSPSAWQPVLSSYASVPQDALCKSKEINLDQQKIPCFNASFHSSPK